MAISGISSSAAILQLFQQRLEDLASFQAALQTGNSIKSRQALAAAQQVNQEINAALEPNTRIKSRPLTGDIHGLNSDSTNF